MISPWSQSSPKSLQQLSADYINDNVIRQFLEEASPEGRFSTRDTLWRKKHYYKLREGLVLPYSLWEMLLRNQTRVGDDQISLLLALSDVPAVFPLQKIYLRNATRLRDEILEQLMLSFPTELDIHNCPGLTKNTFNTINKYGKNLNTLVIGNSIQILPTEILQSPFNNSSHVERTNTVWRSMLGRMPNFFGSSHDPPEDTCQSASTPDSYKCLVTPNLKKLVIWGLHVAQGQTGISPREVDYWKLLTEQFIGKLVYLDLSYCQQFSDFNFLISAKKSLQHLILHDVLIPDEPRGWDILIQMSNLRFLDISQSMELAAVYNQPDDLLRELLDSLKSLSALDISGTNLAGHGASEIVGLASRMETPLEFLGLLGSHYNACKRFNIPAKRITGSSNEKQLMDSLNCYIGRPGMLKKVLRMLYGKLIKSNDFCYTQQCLSLTMDALEMHLEDKHVLLVGLCVLFNLMKRSRAYPNAASSELNPVYYSSKFKKRILGAVMKAIERHSYDMTLLRNSFLVLCLLDIAEDLAPVIRNLASVLLLSLEQALINSDFFLMRTAYFLLKPIIGVANRKEKKHLGDKGIVKRLCTLVDTCLKKDLLDYMTENWIILEHLTDDINENCKEFIRSRGLDIFMKFKTKPSSDLSLAAAIGVLSNVACVPSNRIHLMKKEYISTIFEMMSRSGDGNCDEGIEGNIRLSYVASGCMIYLLDESSWSCDSPTKLEILKKLQELLISWDVRRNMGIEHANLKPILDTLKAPYIESRSYATWTLANLTFREPKKYIPMLGDLSYFLSQCKNVTCDDIAELQINALTKLIMNNVKKFVSDQNSNDITAVE